MVVDAQHVTHLQPLTVGRDYGTALEILGGLQLTDWIVLNPADALEDGVQVNVKEGSDSPGWRGQLPSH